MKRARAVALAVVCLCLTRTVWPQSSPFLPEDLYRKLTNELSGEIAFDYLRNLTQYHAPNGASRDVRAEAQWIATRAKEIGLQDVTIHQLPFNHAAWSPLAGEAWLVETRDGKPVETKLGSYEAAATSIADNSRPSKVEAELIDVGPGTSDSDYDGKDVSGKVVLAGGPPTTVEEQAVWKRGALGIVSYYSSRIVPSDYPDQIAWSRIHEKAEQGHEPSFAWIVSYRTGQMLRQKLGASRNTGDSYAGEKATATPGTMRVRIHIESQIAPDNHQEIVEGWIRGSKIHDQQIFLTAHMQEERTSANDDRSGVANVLEIARALTTMIRDGRLPRPERDIRFWWTNEIDSEYTYFAAHPDERKNIFADINQDMVGARFSDREMSRVQHVTFTPWSRPTFFNDVLESVVTALYHGNNSYLGARQAGSVTPGSPYPKPIYSLMGSRDRYSIELVPFFNNSDHMDFNDAVIGATHGATTFTNWPDEYIHSSGDDLEHIDRTTLKRNAVAVSALAWFMANVGERDAPTLNAIVTPAALARLQRAVRNAIEARTDGRASNVDVANTWAQARQREIAVLASIPAGKSADSARADFERATKVPEFGQADQPNPPGAAWATRIPTRNPNIAEFIAKRHDFKAPKGLSSLMQFEAMNFADGKLTMWNIYQAIRAESLGEGEWYYGKVTPEAVQEYFEAAEKAGLVKIAQVPQTSGSKN